MVCKRQCQENEETNHRLGENYFQKIHLRKNCYPKYIKNSYNATVRKQAQKHNIKQTFYSLGLADTNYYI